MVMIDAKSNIDVTSLLERALAQKIVRRIAGEPQNETSFSRHVRERMTERDLGVNDIVNVLCAGRIYQNPEYKKGHWRYRVETNKIAVVIAFRSIDSIAVVTAWRK